MIPVSYYSVKSSNDACGICRNPLEGDVVAHKDPHSERNIHDLHRKCLTTWFEVAPKLECPLCFVPVNCSTLVERDPFYFLKLRGIRQLKEAVLDASVGVAGVGGLLLMAEITKIVNRSISEPAVGIPYDESSLEWLGHCGLIAANFFCVSALCRYLRRRV